MTNLVTFEQFDETIRQTPDGRFSVYDVIRFCGKKNPRDAWRVLIEKYSECVGKTDTYKFPGKGWASQPTPITDREGILYIIGLLPGVVGRSYRESAAKVFLRYLDADPELAGSVIDRATPEDLKKIERRLAARLKGKTVRIDFTDTLQAHGVRNNGFGDNGFANCTNAIYRPLFGKDAQQLKRSKGLSKSAKLRDHMETNELVDTAFAERLAAKRIEKQNVYGNHSCQQVSGRAARDTRQLLDS